MPVSPLKTLRVRVDHLVLGVGAVAVVVGGLLAWRAMQPDADKEAEIEQGLERVRAKQGATRSHPRFTRGMFSGAPDEGEGKFSFEPPPPIDPGAPAASEAVDAFQQVIGELEAALESGRKLGSRERAELYQRATGSFTAMSAWVDPNEASERAMMDDAYAQMMALMRELDIRPPRRDPDQIVRPN